MTYEPRIYKLTHAGETTWVAAERLDEVFKAIPDWSDDDELPLAVDLAAADEVITCHYDSIESAERYGPKGSAEYDEDFGWHIALDAERWADHFTREGGKATAFCSTRWMP